MTEGLSFKQAKAASLRGSQIKRALWETWLIVENGALIFQLTNELARRLGNSFEPHDSDLVALDWQAR